MRGEGESTTPYFQQASHALLIFSKGRFEGNHPPSGMESRTSETGYH